MRPFWRVFCRCFIHATRIKEIATYKVSVSPEDDRERPHIRLLVVPAPHTRHTRTHAHKSSEVERTKNAQTHFLPKHSKAPYTRVW